MLMLLKVKLDSALMLYKHSKVRIFQGDCQSGWNILFRIIQPWKTK